MRVLVTGDAYQLQIMERDEPVAGPGDAVLAIDAVGVCGSDVHGFSGETNRRPPGMVMGHEIGARVIACEAEPGWIGQTVTVFPVYSCGRCRSCAQDRPSLCADAKVIGVTPELQGGFAERIVVPASHVVPLEGTAVHAAALVEPLAVGLHAARQADLAGGSVLVIGAGVIGATSAYAALRAGAAAVYAVDISSERLGHMAALGVTVPTDTTVDFAGWTHEVHGDPVDVVIDAVGSSTTLDTAFRAVRRGGSVVVVGMGSPRVDLDLFQMVTAERAVLGSFCYGWDTFRQAASWMARGVPQLEALVTRVVAFSEAAAAMTALANRSDMAPRILISPAAETVRRASNSLPTP